VALFIAGERVKASVFMVIEAIVVAYLLFQVSHKENSGCEGVSIYRGRILRSKGNFNFSQFGEKENLEKEELVVGVLGPNYEGNCF
jgi:hypothetical protein